MRESVRQSRTITQHIAERNLTRQLTLEAKYRNTQFAAPPFERAGLARRDPVAAKPPLIRRQNSIFDSRLRQRLQRFLVHRAFRQPHPLRPPPKTIDEILDTPTDLDFLVARAQQRQYRMAVGLRHRIAVAAALFRNGLVAHPNRAVGRLPVPFHPAQQRRPEIEVERFVIVENPDHAPLHDMGVRVGVVTFTQNPLVPVGERGRTRLRCDQPGPRAFPRRLIEMSMYNYITWLIH